MINVRLIKLFNLIDISIREGVDSSVFQAISDIIKSSKIDFEKEVNKYIEKEILNNYDTEDCYFRKAQLLIFKEKYEL